MGVFSWRTADTDESIPNIMSSRPTFPVYLLHPDREPLKLTNYNGYGEFDSPEGRVNVFKWLARENDIEAEGDELYKAGCELYHSGDGRVKLKLARSPHAEYDECAPSSNDPKQGFFY
jgi:hypothetical protein